MDEQHGVTTTATPWPIIKIVRGDGNHGFSLWPLFGWRAKAGVDHEQGFAILQDHHVLADGPQSPEGDDFERLFSHVANRCLRYARWRL